MRTRSMGGEGGVLVFGGEGGGAQFSGKKKRGSVNWQQLEKEEEKKSPWSTLICDLTSAWRTLSGG